METSNFKLLYELLGGKESQYGPSFKKCPFRSPDLITPRKGKKIGQLPRAKPILVALKVNFSNYGEGKALCDRMASGTLSIDGEMS